MSISLKGIGHKFDSTNFLFRGITKTLKEGNTYGIVGPSGAGKTTLLNIMSGMLEPFEGEVAADHEGSTYWVFQNPYGVGGRTALDQVVLPIIAAGESRHDAEAIAREILERVNLGYAGERLFSELSGGEAQRLMLARAMAAKPHLLLVDEPTAQLDLQAAEVISKVLGNLSQEGTIVVIASHDQNVINACSDVIDLHDYM